MEVTNCRSIEKDEQLLILHDFPLSLSLDVRDMSSEFSLSRSLRSMSCSSLRPTASQMTSSEDGCLSNIYEDADSTDACPSSVYADQESIRSSDIECNSESVRIDSISDQVSQPNSEELCASSPSSGTAEQVRTPPKIEVAHQVPAKKRRLRMMD